MSSLHGWLIVNRFLYTKKFSELYEWLCTAANRLDIKLSVYTNDEIALNIAVSADAEDILWASSLGGVPDFVLFFDKDIRLAEQLERRGLRLFNSARSIELCDDKSLMHSALAGKVPMPDTYCAPFTYENIGYNNTVFIDTMFEKLGSPLVVKEVFGSFGQQVYLCNSPAEARELLARVGGKKLLFQRFINSSFGRDLRLNVVGGKVIASMYRYNEHGDFRANITNGGSMRLHMPTPEEEAVAIETAEALDLDFCGVDLLFGDDSSPILCEVNSNAHFKSIYQCTGVNAANAIMEYIADTFRR